MSIPERTELSRREAQIMEILHRRGRATAAQVQNDLADPPSYSSVRKLLEILEQKGHISHEQDGRRYVYSPSMDREQAGRSALQKLLRTFFGGSPEKVVAALLDVSDRRVSAEELDRIAELAEWAKEEGR